MADWMDDAVKRTKERFGAQQVEDERFVREDKLKRQLGAQFYDELRGWLHRAEKDFNTRYGSQVLIVTDGSQSEVLVKGILTRAENKTSEVSYNDDLQQISWITTTGAQHVIQLKLSGSNGMLAHAGTEECTAVALGQKLLDGVLP